MIGVADRALSLIQNRLQSVEVFPYPVETVEHK